MQKINEMASELLKNFGEYYDPNPYYINGTLEVYTRLINYGIEIRYYHKSNIIEILYENQTVYKQGILHYPGVWEQILEEYYNKIPTIIKHKEEQEIRRNKCDHIAKMMERYLGSGLCVTTGFIARDVQVTDSIRMVSKIGKDEYGWPMATFIILYNGQEVFCEESCEAAEEFAQNNIFYPKYIPGEWEEELEKHIQRLNENAENERAQSYLRQLKKI